MSKPWVRLYRDAILKPKVGKLALDDLGFWAACLMLSDDDGNLPSVSDLAWQLRLNDEVIEKGYLASLIRNGLVTRYVTDGVTKYRLHDWDTHQRLSDYDVSGAERQKRFRERQKVQKSAVPDPVTDRNALRHASVTLPDTDTDTDKTLTSFVSVQPVVPDAPRAKRGTSLPADFVMPSVWVRDGEALRQKQGKRAIDLEAEAERFVNHFVANGKPMKDWRRAWLNWATSPYVDQLSKGANNGRARAGFTDTMRDIAGEIRDAEARAGRGGGVPSPGAGGRDLGDGED